ncbi:MAG: hypothetical protein J6D47_11205 [Peptostreptococcaceae bacterium]|nr:hypothetical protein [Peptostreptococcaceae bacterium]
MSTLKAKELLAEKFDNYMNNKKLGIPVIAGEFYEQDESTVKGSIYNKLFRSQIDMQKLENKYIDEGKEIDITKATKRLKELEKNIEKTKTALNNFSKNYQEELEKLQDQELAQEHSVMGRIGIMNKYNTLSENMENLPTYQNLSSELNDLNVEKFLLEKKIKEYEEENHVLIKEILAQRKKEQVEQYLQSKEI